MKDEQFWKLIEISRNGPAARDLDKQAEQLTLALSKLPPAEVAGFAQKMDELINAAYSWELWGAAYLINGGCSDDGFEYFRRWLIAQGPVAYREALKNPNSLAAIAKPDECEFEDIAYIAREVYEELTGREMPDSGVRHPKEPSGSQWDFDDADAMAAKFPALWKKFGY